MDLLYFRTYTGYLQIVNHPANKSGLSRRRRCALFIVLTLLLVFTRYRQYYIYLFDEEPSNSVDAGLFKENEDKYLISTASCRIPDNNPFHSEITPFLRNETFNSCLKQEAQLTYITNEYNSSTLHINESVLSSYSFFKITCCYSEVHRLVWKDNPDSDVEFSECKSFEGSVKINHSLLMVNCYNQINLKVYSNVHAIVSEQFIPKRKSKVIDFKTYPTNKLPISVLFVGIDSISKSNLVRTMPQTYKFLESNDFLNLKGYTKIADNTFPNLMAILTGKTSDQVYDFCHPERSPMDKCDIIWNTFKDMGYVTAYAEDQVTLNTFNYNRMGFFEAPTDFYFRPYMISAEMLNDFRRFGMPHCSGSESSGERIMNLARDFVKNIKHYPKFGLFWMNTFSHENINLPSSMDDKVLKFLQEVYSELENTIFVFFSDHGFRFGKIRYTHTGWLEERLPFIYLHFPNKFKQEHTNEYKHLKTNTQRLTNPYDIYMTLQDVLYLTNTNYTKKTSLACPKCHSLFKEINKARTCSDGAIDKHWCLCTGYLYINPRKPSAIEVADYVISEINNLIKTYPENGKCAVFYVRRIKFIGMSHPYQNENNETVNAFYLMIETRPSAMFEATIERLHSSRYRLLGEISRINRYGESSKCVEDLYLKKYCYCNGLFTTIKSALCKFSECI